MGFLANWHGNQAYNKHAKGDMDGARVGYAQAYAEGMDSPKQLLGYAILLLRENENEQAIEVLKRCEKAKNLLPDQHVQLKVHYAIAAWKLGNIDRAIEVLDNVFQKNKTGFTYGTLGYLLIEKGDLQRALALNEEALAYDEDDAVFLDNLAQTYYRLAHDKQKAKPYFDRAYAKKPTAIDTNYFLAQYDIDEGKWDDALDKLEVSLEGKFSPLNYCTREMVEQAIEAVRAKKAGGA